MKKILLCLMISMFVLIGCKDNSESVSSGIIRNTANIEMDNNNNSYDKDVLEDIQKMYENSHFPSLILDTVDVEFNNLKDEKLKEEILTLTNNAVLKMLENKDKGDIFKLFYPNYVVDDPKKIKYAEYLNEDVKQMVVFEVYPTYRVIEENNLIMIPVQKYLDIIELGQSRDEVEDLLKTNKIRYHYINHPWTRYIVLSDTSLVIEFDESSGVSMGYLRELINIFEIKDKHGKVVNPDKLLKTIDTIQSIDERAESDKRIEEMRKEELEKKTIIIGMTKDEVKSRWGEPEDINRTITEYSTNEQWVYGDKYVYFEDGILTAIQD